ENAFFFRDLSLSTARVYLSTLVGAVITVVGVVFSLTILTVSTASGQFGPRILNNFMRDKGNQITLGVYTSTFVYASTILISLYEDPQGAFVPYLSIFTSYIMALFCIGFLIYYVHHIPQSLRVENIVHKIAIQAMDMIECKFPQEEKLQNLEVLDSPKKVETYKKLERQINEDIYCKKTGYVQAIDLEGLTKWAQKQNVLVCMALQPGDFSSGKTVLAKTNKVLDEKQRQEINDYFAFGIGRTLPQNLMYLLSQLIEVAVRALSPGINDPITAMSCIDWLEANLLQMLDKDSKYSIIKDKEKKPRIILRPLGTEEVFGHLDKTMREHVATNFSVSMHWMNSLERLHQSAKSDGQREVIKCCAKNLLASCKHSIPVKEECGRIREVYEQFSKESHVSERVDYPSRFAH
ncbi:MAG: DUF2254 domain-containing protein, partial [Bacteriovoracaceae bacterium]|nr:DUF2254 domain-containing protein [Bacteriovoracaceae bacterium]